MKNIITISLLFALVLILGNQAIAQESENKKANARWAVKVDPMHLIPYTYPTIKLGAEYRFLSNFSVEQSFGIYPKIGHIFNDRTYNTFASHTELRFYLRRYPPRKMNGLYLALEGIYAQSTYDFEAWYAIEEDGQEQFVCAETIEINRSTYRGNGKLGWQLITKSGFLIDVYAGFGIRRERVAHDERACRPDAYLYSNENKIIDVDAHEIQDRLKESRVLAIKLGWAF